MAVIPINEAAKQLGTDVPTVRSLVRTGALAARTVNGTAMVEEHEVARYLREHAADDRGRINYRE